MMCSLPSGGAATRGRLASHGRADDSPRSGLYHQAVELQVPRSVVT